MFRKLFVTVAAAALCWTVVVASSQTMRLPSAQGASPDIDTPCTNIWKNEPLVVYDVSGSTIAGPLHRHLAVYNSGIVSYTDVPLLGGPVTARQTVVTEEVAQQLLLDLTDAGAFLRCDGHLFATDTPLKTVTVFSGSFSNTFSYYSGSSFVDVQLILDEFIADLPVR